MKNILRVPINSIRDNYLLHVNLIACNPAVGKAVHTEQASVKKFALALKAMNINVSIRKSLGSDIEAACGQLAAKEKTTK